MSDKPKKNPDPFVGLPRPGFYADVDPQERTKPTVVTDSPKKVLEGAEIAAAPLSIPKPKASAAKRGRGRPPVDKPTPWDVEGITKSAYYRRKRAQNQRAQ